MSELGISKQDIEFLKELQHELLTQDHVCQASPRFWVVQGTIREYGIDSQYSCDGSTLVHTEEWSELAETMKEAFEYLTTEFEYADDVTLEFIESEDKIVATKKDDLNHIENLCDLDDVQDFIGERNNSGFYEVCHYRNVAKNYENTMFLTNRECKAHIKANYYHYPKDAHSYAMTASRAPEVSKVWNILEKINCDELLKLAEDK